MAGTPLDDLLVVMVRVLRTVPSWLIEKRPFHAVRKAKKIIVSPYKEMNLASLPESMK